MRDEIMKLTKSGEIEQRLVDLRTEIEVRTRTILAMDVNEETYKEVKKARADFNRDFKEIEDRRIALKKAFMQPYDEFEALYKANVTDVFKPAEKALKQKIDDVESGLKSKKKEELVEYFNEYCESIDLEAVGFDLTGIQINLTTTLKKYKEEAKDWADKRKQDIEWITAQENAEEIMMEYDKCFNAIQAANIVKAREEAKASYLLKIAREKQAEEEKEKAAQKVLETMQDEDALKAPEVVSEQEPIYEVTFTVNGTKEQIKALKEYLLKEGLIYG